MLGDFKTRIAQVEIAGSHDSKELGDGIAEEDRPMSMQDSEDHRGKVLTLEGSCKESFQTEYQFPATITSPFNSGLFP